MNYCGAFGPGFASVMVGPKGKKNLDRWLNWKNCKYLTMKKYDGPEGASLYPICEKGFIIDKQGSQIGRLHRGCAVTCTQYDEIEKVVKPRIVEREELEEMGIGKYEINRICGEKIII